MQREADQLTDSGQRPALTGADRLPIPGRRELAGGPSVSPRGGCGRLRHGTIGELLLSVA